VQLLSCLIEWPLKKLAPHLPMVTPLMLRLWLQYSMWLITWLESVNQQVNVDFPVYTVSEVLPHTQPQLPLRLMLQLNYR
jgi:CRISPR/Cas system endoribonuclease Cas6 (RAMP superfamily)